MMPESRVIAAIMLSRLKGVDYQFCCRMAERGVMAEDFVKMSAMEQGAALGMQSLPSWDAGDLAEAESVAKREYDFCSRHHIKVLSPLLENYPRRLEVLDGMPICIYVLGDANLDAQYSISVVGTRKLTARGAQFTKEFVAELSELVDKPLIVSGLAYGTDAAAHNAALDSGLPTVGVLAHGLGMIYPAQHRELAKKILRCGGALVTEYLYNDKPFRGHFLERNGLIAALSDGVLVVESAVKGGAMNTAHYGLEFSRAVMAVPGRTSDEMSEGCNMLIRRNVAELTVSARQACDSMGWKIDADDAAKEEASLFREPEAELMPVYVVMRDKQEPVGFDTLMARTGIPAPRLSSMLFMLEEDGFITRLPNNRFEAV